MLLMLKALKYNCPLIQYKWPSDQLTEQQMSERFYGSLGRTILPFSYAYSTFATICALSRNGRNSQCTVIGSSGKKSV